MAEATPLLNPVELYDKRRSKDHSRLRAYNKILEQIYHRIRVISKLHHSPCFLLYTVPPFILGLPKIDLEDCIVYLIYQLRHAGYEVRYTPPNMVYISWVHHETSYIIQQSPIMHAMMESAERTQAELERKEKEDARLISQRKSQRKVRIQTPGFTAYPPKSSAMASLRPSVASSLRPSAAVSATTNLKPSAGPSAGPSAPSAAAYVPPTTFIKSMTSPENNTTRPSSVPEYFI
jgi:hypothetical protein